ncbi:E3 ubiquitin-protein ligase TRAIP isoform X2 [Agrilus planipennis]|uniref:E3 ubiquitin-protein ligase TRAIP isoform X2 n=1 Tax=Agrilus planipennis TaxID=224129 RepID=A0A1W4XA34_AGRPL|nr:E3 ubiquitin-protein ligase TRAIP isoform X2 [Agrilus planipennis]
MDILCSICNDSLDTVTETHSTPCGHIFHYVCLIQWIRQSRTCPQCRHKATEKTIHRVYFNKANVSDVQDDISLQSKYDNLNFQLKLKEMDLKSLKEKYTKIESQNMGLKNEVKTLQSELATSSSVCFALKDQISYFKARSKEREKLADEVQRLKEQLKDMEHVEIVLSGTKDEVDNMLRENNNIQSLQLLVATLKRELVNVDKKKKKLYSLLKDAEGVASQSKKEVSELHKEIHKLRQEVQNYKESETERQYLKEKLRKLVCKKKDEDSNVSISNVDDNRSLQRIIYESPAPAKQHDMTMLQDTRKDEKAKAINDSDSPYLPVKSNSLGFTNFINTTKTKSLISLSQKPSVFASQSGQMQPAKKPQGSYDGMGGYIRDDFLASSPKREDKVIVGMKRHHSKSAVCSKKRKVAPLSCSKIDDFLNK